MISEITPPQLPGAKWPVIIPISVAKLLVAIRYTLVTHAGKLPCRYSTAESLVSARRIVLSEERDYNHETLSH